MKRAFEELVRGQVWCYCRALEALAPAVHALGEVDLEMARECLREDMARWAAASRACPRAQEAQPPGAGAHRRAVPQRRLASAAVGCPAGVHIAVQVPRAARCPAGPGRRRCQLARVAPEGGRRPPGPPGRGPIRPRGLRSDVEEAQPPRASAYATYPRRPPPPADCVHVSRCVGRLGQSLRVVYTRPLGGIDQEEMAHPLWGGGQELASRYFHRLPAGKKVRHGRRRAWWRPRPGTPG